MNCLTQKIKKYLAVLSMLIAIAYANHSLAQQRNVYWVHGLGGDSNSWQAYTKPSSNFMRQYPSANVLTPQYDSGRGIVDAANELDRRNVFSPAQDNIVIAHSMGSLVTREYNRVPNRSGNIGGFITFTGPHAGAPIGQSIVDGDHDVFLQNSLRNILVGPASTLDIVFPITTTLTTLLVSNLSVRMVARTLLPDLLTQLAGGRTLRPNDPSMIRLNTDTLRNVEKPRVSIVGVENQPTFWRIVSGMMKDPSKFDLDKYDCADLNAPIAAWFFGAQYAACAYVIGAATIQAPNPVTALMAAKYGIGSYAFITGINRQWHRVIGASRESTKGVTLTYLKPACFNPFRRACWRLVTVTRTIGFTIHTPTPSDGVVPVVSQEKLPGKLPFGDLPQNRIIGANHFEVRNHKTTTQVLKKVFNGDPDPIFKIN